MANRKCTAKVRLEFRPTPTNTLDDLQIASCSLGGAILDLVLTNGVSAGQCSRAWEDLDRELTAGNSFTLDLYDFAGVDIGAGDGSDPLGQAMDLEEIVAIAVVMDDDSDVTGQLEITPDPLNGWYPIGEHTVTTGGALRAGGCLLKTQSGEVGYDVVDGAANRIKFAAVGGLCRFSIYIIARHDEDDSSSSSSSLSTSSSSSTSSLSSLSSSTSSSLSSLSDSSSSSTSSVNSSSSSTSSINSSSSSSSTSSVNSSSSSTSSVNSSSSSSTSSVNSSSSSSSSTSSVNSSSSTSSVNSSSSSSSTSSASSSSSS